MLKPGDEPAGSRSRLRLAARIRLARPRPGAAPGHAGLPAPRRRGRPPRSAARSQAFSTCASATTSCTRTMASASCPASRPSTWRGSLATTSARLPRRGPPLRPARADRQGHPLRRRRRQAPALSKLGGKAWDHLKTRARAHLREMAGELLRSTRSAARPGFAFDAEDEWSRGSRPIPLPRDGRPAAGDRRRQGRHGAPRPMDRLVCGDVGFGKTEVAMRARLQGRGRRQAGADARADDDPRPAALAHVPRALPRLAGRVEMVSRFRTPAEVKRVLADFRDGQGRRPDRHAPRALARRRPEGSRPRHRRRGAALRRGAEGAAAPAAARGRRARAERDADPAHAAHVARGPARHLRDRDAARRAAARSAPTSASTTRSWSTRRSRASSPAAASRSTCTTASRRSRRRPRSCGSSSRAEGAGRPRADGASTSSRT